MNNSLRHIRFISLLVLMLVPLSLVSQTRVVMDHRSAKIKITKSAERVNYAGYGVHHLVGMYVDGGYSTLFSNYSGLNSKPGGYGLGFGVEYAYLYYAFMFQTGIAFRWQDVRNTVPNDSLVVPGLIDSDNGAFDLRYDFTDQTDQARSLYVQLPILVGRYIGRFYFLVGPKLSMAVAGNTLTKATITTTGTYNRYIDIMEEMDNHGFRKQVEETYKVDRLKLRFDVMAYGEFGYEWSLNDKNVLVHQKSKDKGYRIRVSAFAEYGLLNICPRADKQRYVIPESSRYDFSTFEINPVANTESMWNAKMHALTTGVKLSFYFRWADNRKKYPLLRPRK